MLHRLRSGHLGALRRHPQALEPPRRRQDPRLQRPDRPVVALDRLAQSAAHPVHVPAKGVQPVIELSRLVGDLAGVPGQHLLLPAVGDGFHQRDQGGGRAHQHPRRQRRLEDLGVLLHRGRVERLPRHEQHHEVRRLGQGVPVFLGAQLADMGLELAGVPRERLGLGGGLGRLQRGQVGVERGLGVDHHRFPARQADQRVGAAAAVLGVEAVLGEEVDMLHHPGHLEDLTQLVLPPAAAGLGRAQGLDQAAGLGVQPRLPLGQRLHLGADGSIGVVAGLLDLPHRRLELAEVLADRQQQPLDRFLPAGQVLVRGLLVLVEALGDEAEEALGVAAQRVGGERGELLLDLALHPPQLLDPRAMLATFGLERGLQFGAGLGGL